jgi:hypothetical protein
MLGGADRRMRPDRPQSARCSLSNRRDQRVSSAAFAELMPICAAFASVDAPRICTKLRHCSGVAQRPAFFRGFPGNGPDAAFLFCAAATIWLD